MADKPKNRRLKSKLSKMNTTRACKCGRYFDREFKYQMKCGICRNVQGSKKPTLTQEEIEKIYNEYKPKFKI